MRFICFVGIYAAANSSGLQTCHFFFMGIFKAACGRESKTLASNFFSSFFFPLYFFLLFFLFFLFFSPLIIFLLQSSHGSALFPHFLFPVWSRAPCRRSPLPLPIRTAASPQLLYRVSDMCLSVLASDRGRSADLEPVYKIKK